MKLGRQQEDFNERRPRGRCGKMAFSKKDAQTTRNRMHQTGYKRGLHIYQCPECIDVWHLTKK